MAGTKKVAPNDVENLIAAAGSRWGAVALNNSDRDPSHEDVKDTAELLEEALRAVKSLQSDARPDLPALSDDAEKKS